MEKESNLATYDIENLYGNITHELGLEAINFWLSEKPPESHRISNEFILGAIRLILENNIFFFNDMYYRQLKGTAMGTKMAPIYATLVLGFLEKKLYNEIYTNYDVNTYLSFKNYYFRYLDDVLIIYDENKLPLETITTLLNNLCVNFHFKLESSGQQVHFLDICIVNVGGIIQTDVYYKPTDTHQYLNFHSNHPRHVKRALPYNLARRICTIVSNPNIRNDRLQALSLSLKKCNYHSGLIDDGISKALSFDRNNLLNPVKRNINESKNTIVHVSTYNPNYCSKSGIINGMFSELKENKLTKNIFVNNTILLSKRQPPNLKGLLTQAKFSDLKKQGVNRCGSPRCKLCEIIIEGEAYNFKNTNYNFSVKSHMTCDTRNCIYVLQCGGCSKYYIGETNNFRLRINLHKDHAKKKTGLGVSRHIFECTANNSCEYNFLVMPFFKLKDDDAGLRKSTENYFIKKNLNLTSIH